LGEKGEALPGPVIIRNLIERGEKGDRSVSVTNDIGGTLLADAMKIGAELGLQLASLYVHETNLDEIVSHVKEGGVEGWVALVLPRP
jgi:hypothetical protein